MFAKVVLGITGVLYLALGIFCAVLPGKASETVHLTREGAGGNSEFFTVYGGLEFGMGLIFLLPVIFPNDLRAGLWSCLLIHASLVAFRTISLMLYAGAFSQTRSLVIGEWVVLLLTAAALYTHKA